MTVSSSKAVKNGKISTDVLVLGGGPGGYTAAFRAADLGQSVVLVEQRPELGGVCLNVGCIPSKALLHTVAAMETARDLASHGIEFVEPKISLDKLRAWKSGVTTRLGGGLAGLAKQRKVQVIHGVGQFTGPNTLSVGTAATIEFKHAIIAVGSNPTRLPFMPEDHRVMDSTGALALEDIPERLLVLGGGIIGLEMATVYAGLGSRVTIVELTDGLLPGCDRDLVKPLVDRMSGRFEAILTSTKVIAAEAKTDGIYVSFEGANAPKKECYDRVLVAVGRRPNGKVIAAEKAGVNVTEDGFIKVDNCQRTNVAHIFAIGDVVPGPMLAHKAAFEGKVAAEVASGHKASNSAKVIPSVAYTDPEIAWVGMTETEAKRTGIRVEKAVFPWKASGRALSMGRDEGVTKVLVDPETRVIVGAGIVGAHAGDLISEAVLAIEMGCEPGDVGLTIHPHPTLSETFAFAAEAYEGTLTELFVPKKR